ncbi:MAG: metallophosphoesterase [Streptococcus pyogenes]|nr:MAG: metallophosphoesterase [Streptococcus pyogenes]
MKFLHLSDTHIRRDYHSDWFTDNLFSDTFNPTDNLRFLLSSLNPKDYDFALITGDLTHEGQAEDYALLRTIWKDYMGELPYFFCRGNHDQRQAFFEGMEIPLNASLTYFNVAEFEGLRIISLDSAQDSDHEGYISQEQLEQLKHALAKPSEKGSIVLLHHPLMWEDKTIATSRPADFDQIIAASDIKAIFVGHIHMGSMATYQGIPQIMAESMAFGTDEFPDESIFSNRTGYNEIVLEGEQVYVYGHLVSPEQKLLGQLSKPFDNHIFNSY